MAFNETVIAIDGNVKRVSSRLFCLEVVDPKEIAEKLLKELPLDKAGLFNEALIELGALVCNPKHPSCDSCPVKAHCTAFQTDRVDSFPKVIPKKPVPKIERYALIYQTKSHIWLRKRPTDELLGGLWGFVLSEALAKEVSSADLPPVKHAYTHFKIRVKPLMVTMPPPDSEPIALEKLKTLALSKLDRKILAGLAALGSV
ncbi:MAG: NUDIX domain-containing protein [Deinococcales bacterium]